VVETYENPRAEEAGMSREQWLRDRQLQRKEKTRRRVVKDVPDVQTFGPKITVINDFREYAKVLEELISQNLGVEYLPERPATLKGL